MLLLICVLQVFVIYRLLLVNKILECLTGLEFRNSSSRDLDSLACLRIVSGACSTLCGLEGTEADKLNLTLLLQLFGYCAGEGVQSLLTCGL